MIKLIHGKNLAQCLGNSKYFTNRTVVEVCGGDNGSTIEGHQEDRI